MKSNIRNTLLLFFAISSLMGNELPPDHLLRGIASEEFSVRESAQAELIDWSMKHPKSAASILLRLSESNEDPEVRKRALNVLRVLAEADYLSDGQGYVGIMMNEEMLEAGEEGEFSMGIRVLDVMEGSPAAKADLRAGDMIIALDGAGWKGNVALAQFSETIAAKKPLVEVKLTVRRAGGEPLEITVKLGKRPIADLRAAGGDLRLFEERAREQHFKEWLGKQKRQAE